MNRFYQGDWIDSMASRFIDELPDKNIEKNSFFDEEINNDEDFDFNQDNSIELGDEYKELFIEAGGDNLDYVESLNYSDTWADAIIDIIK